VETSKCFELGDEQLKEIMKRINICFDEGLKTDIGMIFLTGHKFT
jgi:hypothetical protein